MATQIYLGNPPENIKKWIEEHVQTGPVFKDETQVVYHDGTTWEGLIEGELGYSSIPNIELSKEITLGNKITKIGSGVFAGSSICIINIPNSVTMIDSGAFYNCTNLTFINIPNSITTIESSAFGGCSSLTTITIPISVSNLNGGVFYECTSLTSVIFEGRTLEEVQAMDSYPWSIEDTSIIKVA